MRISESGGDLRSQNQTTDVSYSPSYILSLLQIKLFHAIMSEYVVLSRGSIFESQDSNFVHYHFHFDGDAVHIDLNLGVTLRMAIMSDRQFDIGYNLI